MDVVYKVLHLYIMMFQYLWAHSFAMTFDWSAWPPPQRSDRLQFKHLRNFFNIPAYPIVQSNQFQSPESVAEDSLYILWKNFSMSSINLHPEYDHLHSLYKLEEKGNKFYLPSKSLQSLEKYFDSFVPTRKLQSPSIISWYNSLSRSEQADILVVSKVQWLM